MFGNALPFIHEYVNALSQGLKKFGHQYELSSTQKKWIKFCLMGILITNSLKWSKFYRGSLGAYKISSLSWMFRYSKIFWEKLLVASTMAILEKFGLAEGVLVIDDSDKKRCKRTKRIHFAHKVFDKSTGGYFNGQSFVVLLLVTRKITIPIGFRFYCSEEECGRLGINHQTKLNLALNLLRDFRNNFPDFKVKASLADAFYGSKDFADGVSEIFPKSQFISQLKSNQNVVSQGKKQSVKEYFEKRHGIFKKLIIRGEQKCLEYLGARLKVDSHGRKRYVIALRYEGEEEYRYLYATNLGWRGEDIIETYGLRWLIEVFFQDCKTFEGLGELQLLDVEGSERALILSFLFDCSLFFHEDQFKLIEDKLSAWSVGSLLEKCRVEAFVKYFKEYLLSENPLEKISILEEGIKSIYQLRKSKKHMVGQDLGKMEPAESLKYRAKKNAVAA